MSLGEAPGGPPRAAAQCTSGGASGLLTLWVLVPEDRALAWALLG